MYGVPVLLTFESGPPYSHEPSETSARRLGQCDLREKPQSKHRITPRDLEFYSSTELAKPFSFCGWMLDTSLQNEPAGICHC